MKLEILESIGKYSSEKTAFIFIQVVSLVVRLCKEIDPNSSWKKEELVVELYGYDRIHKYNKLKEKEDFLEVFSELGISLPIEMIMEEIPRLIARGLRWEGKICIRIKGRYDPNPKEEIEISYERLW